MTLKKSEFYSTVRPEILERQNRVFIYEKWMVLLCGAIAGLAVTALSHDTRTMGLFCREELVAIIVTSGAVLTVILFYLGVQERRRIVRIGVYLLSLETDVDYGWETWVSKEEDRRKQEEKLHAFRRLFNQLAFWLEWLYCIAGVILVVAFRMDVYNISSIAISVFCVLLCVVIERYMIYDYRRDRIASMSSRVPPCNIRCPRSSCPIGAGHIEGDP